MRFWRAFAVYTRGGGELRLIWDGREGALSADYDAGSLIEKRIDWLGPSLRTLEGIPQLIDELKARFGSANMRGLSKT